MQSTLRLASRRLACAAGRRGVAAEAEREWVASLVQREVRDQMRAAKEEEEAIDLLRASVRAEAEDIAADDDLKEGFKMGFAAGFTLGAYAMTFYAVYRFTT